MFGSGREFGCRFTYKVQDEAGGIARNCFRLKISAMATRWPLFWATTFLKTRPVCGSIPKQRRGARILGKAVTDPERFGVAEVVDGIG